MQFKLTQVLLLLDFWLMFLMDLLKFKILICKFIKKGMLIKLNNINQSPIILITKLHLKKKRKRTQFKISDYD